MATGNKVAWGRTLLGAALFLVLVGEVTVGAANGLYTPPGFVVLGSLYIILFLLYESLIVRYKLTNIQLIVLNFAVYGVIITGLLHGEIANYVLHPQDSFITTMIRIQCSLFPVFAYRLLGRFKHRDATRVPKVRTMLIIALGYVILLTPSKKFGLINAVQTLQTAPVHTIVWCTFATLGLLLAFGSSSRRPAAVLAKPYPNKWFFTASVFLLAIALIPALHGFIILLFAMPIVTLFFIWRRSFREAPV